MFTRLERDLWPLSVPHSVAERRHNLTHDFTQLVRMGYFPPNPQKTLDIGSGSGAGSMALLATLGGEISAVDNASNWQFDSLYRRRRPPSAIRFYPVDIAHFAPIHAGEFDLIVAARICITLNGSPIDPWTKKAGGLARQMLIMLTALNENGTFALSWPLSDTSNITHMLEDNLLMDRLFHSKHLYQGTRDGWVVWGGLNQSELQKYLRSPDDFLTHYAKTNTDLDPYGLNNEF